MAAEMDVCFFAGNNQKLLIGEAATFVKHGLEQREAFGHGQSGSVDAEMEFAEMNNVHPPGLEGFHESGNFERLRNLVGVFRLLETQQFLRMLDVIVAG